MAADPTLVQGAYKVAASMIPPDLSGFYKERYELQQKTGLMKGITDFFKEQKKEAEAIMDRITEPIDKLLTDIAADGTPGSERLYDETSLLVDSIKEDYKLAVKNKDAKAQHKILGKLNRVINQNTQAGTNLMTIGEFINDGQINAEATGKETFAALEKIIDFDNGNPDVIYSYDNNGDLSYIVQTEYGEQIIKASEISKLVIPFAHGKEGEYNQMRVDYLTSGATEGSLFNFDEAKYNVMTKIINNKIAFADLANRKWGNQTESYKSSLLTNKELWGALTGMGDWNLDGTVNNQDFITEDNVVAVVDALTNINSENFDFTLAKETFGNYLTKELENKYEAGGGGRRKRTVVSGTAAAAAKKARIKAQQELEGRMETLNSGDTIVFENKGTAEGDIIKKQFVIDVLNGESIVYDPASGAKYTKEGEEYVSEDGTVRYTIDDFLANPKRSGKFGPDFYTVSTVWTPKEIGIKDVPAGIAESMKSWNALEWVVKLQEKIQKKQIGKSELYKYYIPVENVLRAFELETMMPKEFDNVFVKLVLNEKEISKKRFNKLSEGEKEKVESEVQVGIFKDIKL